MKLKKEVIGLMAQNFGKKIKEEKMRKKINVVQLDDYEELEMATLDNGTIINRGGATLPF